MVYIIINYLFHSTIIPTSFWIHLSFCNPLLWLSQMHIQTHIWSDTNRQLMAERDGVWQLVLKKKDWSCLKPSKCYVISWPPFPFSIHLLRFYLLLSNVPFIFSYIKMSRGQKPQNSLPPCIMLMRKKATKPWGQFLNSHLKRKLNKKTSNSSHRFRQCLKWD